LFDPFFRPESARTRETGGTGLGLAIVKSCVEACGGEVTVRNANPAGLQVEMELRRAQSGAPLLSSTLTIFTEDGGSKFRATINPELSS
jgi:signal transduction histidine kinase